MSILSSIARRWWVAGALLVAAFYVVIVVGNLSEPGMPILDGAIMAGRLRTAHPHRRTPLCAAGGPAQERS